MAGGSEHNCALKGLIYIQQRVWFSFFDNLHLATQAYVTMRNENSLYYFSCY